jgi:ABC-type Mn2+/Zn2+ transport system ATPase subunit
MPVVMSPSNITFLLSASGWEFLEIVGPGGVGKTALARSAILAAAQADSVLSTLFVHMHQSDSDTDKHFTVP